MTDRPDPRVYVLLGALKSAAFGNAVDAVRELDRIDCADEAVGIVRVDTNDEALVWAIVRKPGLFPPWAHSETEASLVRGILAALREAQ